MKKMKKMKKLLSLLVTLSLTSGVVFPATLSLGSRNLVSEDESNFNISVDAGNQSYDNAGTGNALVTTSLGTVSDYKFFHSPSETIVSYANGGTRISDATSDAANIDGPGLDWSNVWTSSNPGADLTSPSNSKDFSSVLVPFTFAQSAEVDGTINITGLASGTIYIPHGTFRNQFTLTLTMTGAGQTDLVAFDHLDDEVGNNIGWVTDFSFTNEGQYDTIEYNYSHVDHDGSRARFMGLILSDITPIPEPTTSALLCLGGLCLTFRRRRQHHFVV
jgi:hypothetical protein